MFSAPFKYPGAPQLTALSFLTWVTMAQYAAMTSELSKYLNEQLGVFWKCGTAKMKLPKIKKMDY